MLVLSQQGEQGQNSLQLHTRWWVILFPLLFLASFSLSGTSIPNTYYFDASWQASIEYAAAHGWQFGPDILFTYGPLGFLTAKFSQGFFPLLRVFSAVGMTFLTAWLTLSVAKSLSRHSCLIFILWVISFTIYGDMEQNIFFIVACCSLKMIGTGEKIAPILLIPVFLAFLALVKFSFLLIAVIALLICAAYLLLKGRIANAAVISVSFLTAFAVLWKSMGQKPGSLIPWLHGSLEITSGYVEAMYFAPETVTLALSLTAIFLFIFMLIFSARKKIATPLECIPLLLVFLIAFISWKQAFVRADASHILRFINSFPFFAALIIADANKESPPVSPRSPLFISFAAIMVLCIAVIHLNSNDGNFLGLSLQKFTARLETNADQLAKIATGRYKECFPDISARSAKEDLPAIRALVGKDSIDVIGMLSWVAIGNGLNYKPRPVIQSYLAYTPYLQNLNLSFMKSANRPEWLVLKMDSLDKRLPVMEDALLFPWIMRNYSLKWSDENLLLLKLNSAAPTSPPTELLAEKSLSFGEPLDLSGNYDFPVVLQVEIEPTLTGRLAGIFYSRPPLSMVMEFAGEKLTRRFVPLMAKEGFLLSPFLPNINFVKGYYKGELKKIDKLFFVISADAGLYYQDKIKIRISKVAL